MARVKKRPPIPLTRDEAVKSLSKLVVLVGEDALELEVVMAAITLKAVDSRWRRYLQCAAAQRDISQPVLLVPQGVSYQKCFGAIPGDSIVSRLARMLDILVTANSSRLTNGDTRLFARFSAESERLAEIESLERDVRLLLELVDVLPCFGAEDAADSSPYSLTQLVSTLYDWYFPSVTPLDAGFHTNRPLAQLMASLCIPPDGELTIVDLASGSGGFLLAALHYIDTSPAARSISLSVTAESLRAWSYTTMALSVCAEFDWERVEKSEAGGLSKKLSDDLRGSIGSVAIASNLLNLGVEERGLPNAWSLLEQAAVLPKVSQNELSWASQLLARTTTAHSALCMVVPKALLYREGSEQALRQQLVAANLLEAVILLPEYATKGTKGSSALIVLKKYRGADPVLFVDAVALAQEMGDGKLLSDECVQRLLSASRGQAAHEPFAKWATVAEIRVRGFSWKPAEYLALPQWVELPPLEELLQKRKALIDELERLNAKLREFAMLDKFN